MWHYAEMVRARQLPTPTVNHSLSQADMEAAVRRNKLIESAWIRASPKMESLRFVSLPASEHNWIGNIRRGFMVPGGKYFVIFVYDRACILSLEDLSRPPVPFITLQDVNLEGLDPVTCSWTTGRPDDGRITFYIAIRPTDRCVVSGAFPVITLMINPSSQSHSFLDVRILVGRLSSLSTLSDIPWTIHDRGITV